MNYEMGYICFADGHNYSDDYVLCAPCGSKPSRRARGAVLQGVEGEEQ